jgi:hypothetical protein
MTPGARTKLLKMQSDFFGMSRAQGTGPCPRRRRIAMADLLYLGYVVGFFLLTWAFVKLCERV